MSRKLNPAIFHTLDPILDQGELLFGSGASGVVYQMESGNSDDGDAIEARWTSGWLDCGVPELPKWFRKAHFKLEAMGSPMTLSWSVDHGTSTGSFPITIPASSGVWGLPGVWGPSPNSPGVWGGKSIATRRLVISLAQLAKGHAIQLTITSTDTSTPFQLTSYSLWWESLDQDYPEGGI